MRILLTILSIAAVASIAWAEKPVQTVDNPIDRVSCEFGSVVYDWNFADSDHGFTTGPCDNGGVPIWEYAEVTWWPDMIWVTAADADYPIDTGDGLISPSFEVDESAYLVEIWHLYNIEPGYDGANLSVNGVVVDPIEGYPGVISESTNFYAWCVDGEPGFTGFMSPDPPVYTCFDLSDFTGEEVQLSFDFGSDSIVTSRGWAIISVTVGSNVVANEGMTWSRIKGIYR